VAHERFDPIIGVSGSPGQMGLEHGRQLRARIHRTAALMRERIGPQAYEASWEALRPTVEYCHAAAPEMMAEIQGICRGAEVPFSDIFRINAHLDLTNWRRLVWDADTAGNAEACSSHAVVTSSDVLLGWNGDDWPGWLGCGAIVRGRPEGGPPFIYWSLAGSVGRPGLGPHLALGANSLPSPRWQPEGLLYPILCRKLLACRNVGDALSLFEDYERCSAMNYLLAGASGDLVNVESTPDAHAVIQPVDQGADGYLLHTNSYLAASLGGLGIQDCGCPRLAAARRLYQQGPPTDVPGVRAIQSDHSGGVCVHQPEARTIVSFVARVRAGEIHITRGNPCSCPAQSLRLDT